MDKARKSLSVLMALALASCLSLAATLCLPRPVSAAEFHVTTAAEFQAALDAAKNNGQDDTIRLAAGTYLGHFVYKPPDTEHKSLTITGEPGTSAKDIVLDGQNSGKVLYLDDTNVGPVAEIRVNGMTFQNGNSLLAGGGIWAIVASYDIFITDCIIKDNTAQAFGGGIYMDSEEDLYLENNSILNNTVTESDDGHSRGGGAFVFIRSDSATIRNNVITGNEALGTTDPWGGGVYVASYSSAVVHLVGNTICDNQANTAGGVYLSSANTANVYNNIIYGNTAMQGGDIYLSDSISRAGYNNDYSNMYGSWTDSGSNIDSNPALVNPASDDYHLSGGSPCIDAGTTAVPDPPGLPAADFEGNPRVWGAAPDMGAYEWTGGAPPPSVIGFSPPSFSFYATEGGANPADQTLEVWNSGGGTLVWSVADDAAWLGLNPPSDSSTGEHDAVTVSVDISGMSANNYDATITISAPGATNTPQTVPVNLTINPAGAGVTWNFPSTSDVFLAPTPANNRPYLDAAVSLPTGTEPAELLGVYWLDEATGDWQYFIPAFGGGTLTSLEPGEAYLVAVSGACNWQLS
jgi:hypothetical protein